MSKRLDHREDNDSFRYCVGFTAFLFINQEFCSIHVHCAQMLQLSLSLKKGKTIVFFKKRKAIAGAC
jgi:hypothetical protein